MGGDLSIYCSHVRGFPRALCASCGRPGCTCLGESWRADKILAPGWPAWCMKWVGSCVPRHKLKHQLARYRALFDHFKNAPRPPTFTPWPNPATSKPIHVAKRVLFTSFQHLIPAAPAAAPPGRFASWAMGIFLKTVKTKMPFYRDGLAWK